jgi:hypothetical protein
MNPAILMIQAISQDIAMFFCALFAGGSVYVSLVEDPATAKGGAEMGGAYLMTAHPRPAVLQTLFAFVAAAAGLLAGLASGSAWWLAGGALLGFAALLQMAKVIPLVRAVAGAGPEADPAWLARHLRVLARLHAVLSLASLASLFLLVTRG